MEQQEIRDQAEQLNKQLKVLKGEYIKNKKIIEAQLLGLQHICEHPSATSYSDNDIRWPTTYWNCPDCKKST